MSEAPTANALDVRTVAHAPRLRGVIDVPGDKSITHRALMFNALARGTARVDGFLDSDDTRSTMRCLRALGVRIDEVDGGVVVHGNGRAALVEPDDVLDCGNSGTTMRLMSGILAGLPLFSVLTGDASLRQRPMARVVRPLSLLGARLTARASGTLPPIVIEGGPIRGGQRIETAVASAQVKSAILLAALSADGPVTVVEPTASRDHTERLLAAMGASIEVEGTAITLTPPSDDLHAVDVRVPGDISTAAAWIVAGCIHPDAEICLRGVGVNPSRTGLLDVLREMGANLDLEEERVIGGEPVADIVVRSSALRGVEVGGDIVPRAIDELPLIALAGALADGETVITDAAELRVKESDRVATTGALLRSMGVQLEEHKDGMVVQGGARLAGATVQSHSDHRLAMLGAVAGLIASDETTIQGATDVSVSYPEFWRDLEGLRDG